MRLALGIGLALILTACAPAASLPKGPVPAGAGVAVRSETVRPAGPDGHGIETGDFRWMGGMALSSTETSRLHGLSDIVVTTDGRLTAVSDEGDLVQARLALDRHGRLAGLSDVRITGLADLDGNPIQGKGNGDAEGLAVLANGDRLVSFERNSRIWLYPAKGGAPRAVPSPDEPFPENGGMEALAADPAAGPDAYIVGGEDSGKTWSCRVSGTCVPGPTIAKPPEFGLVAMTRLSGGNTAHLLRAWDAARGNRIELRIVGPKGQVGSLEIARPLQVDNFEGVAAVPGKDGATRFYLISDDNFSSSQRTLIFAYDWKSGTGISR